MDYSRTRNFWGWEKSKWVFILELNFSPLARFAPSFFKNLDEFCLRPDALATNISQAFFRS
jgi:hypothetical protein